MRFYEFNLTEAHVHKPDIPTGIKIDDGEFFISDHFIVSMKDRRMTGKEIANLLYDAIEFHKDELLSMGPENFIIRYTNNYSIAIKKVLQVDDTFKYILRTIHDTLKIGMNQSVIVV